jgi:hypothetical protein
VLAAHHLGDNIGRGHHPALGHRGVPSVDRLVSTDELDAAVADPSRPTRASYTTSTDVTPAPPCAPAAPPRAEP